MSTTATPAPLPIPPSEVEAGIDALPGMDTVAGNDTTPEPTPSPAPAPAAEPAPTPAPEPAAVTPDPSAKPEEPSPLGDDLAKLIPAKPADSPEVKEPGTPKELREAYSRVKTEHEKTVARVRELEGQTEKVREELRQQIQKEMQSEVERLRNDLTEREDRLRVADYRQSDEYRETFGKPIDSAWGKAAEAINGVKVTQADGTERDATVNDIADLCRMPERDALRVARERFGDDAALVLKHRDRITDLVARAQQAVEDYRTRGEEQRRQSETARVEQIRRFETEVLTLRSDKTLNSILGADATDKEAADLLAKGDKLVRTALIGDNLPKEASPADVGRARFEAQKMVALRAAAFGPTLLRLNRANAKVAELEAKLKSFEASEPGVGDSSEPAKAEPKYGAEGIDDLPGVSLG